MNEDLVQQLDKATAAHALWKVRLLDAAAGKGEAIDRKTSADPHACGFGKWLDAQATVLADHPEFVEVASRHEAFHRDIGAYLDGIAGGRSRDVAKQLGEDGEFRVTSNRLVLVLLRWQDRLTN